MGAAKIAPKMPRERRMAGFFMLPVYAPHLKGRLPGMVYEWEMAVAATEKVTQDQIASHMVPPVGSDAYIEYMELMHFAEGSAMTPILLSLYMG